MEFATWGIFIYLWRILWKNDIDIVKKDIVSCTIILIYTLLSLRINKENETAIHPHQVVITNKAVFFLMCASKMKNVKVSLALLSINDVACTFSNMITGN